MAMTAMAAAAIIAPIVGGIIGNEASREDREAAKRAANEAYQEILKLGAPPDLSKRIILEKFKQVGLYTPQLEEQVDVGISKVSQIQEDPALRDAQVQGLNLLKQRAETGLNATDRAALNQIRQQAGIDAQAKLEAIKQNMAARGLSGAGSELAQQLSAASSANAEESAAADRLAAQAQQAALQAALQSGQLSGQIRSQDFDVNRTKADAEDRFKQFDVQNSVARQSRNVAAQNQGQMYNIGNEQNVSNANTQMENAERIRQNDAQRQYWQDQAQQAQMRANARLGQSSQLQSEANRTAQTWQGIGSGIGAGAGGMVGKFGGSSSKPTKEPIQWNEDTDDNGLSANNNPYNWRS